MENRGHSVLHGKGIVIAALNLLTGKIENDEVYSDKKLENWERWKGEAGSLVLC